MDSQSIKLELIKLLLETDEPSLLERVRKILVPNADKRRPKNIVGYKPNGEPISQEELAEDLRISLEQARNGEVVSQADLNKDAENW